ncbi:annexin A8-like [Dreissena polymorpha]|nr:annexin A8-like [Dreissena polymorpha]
MCDSYKEHKMATHTQGTVVPSKPFSAEKLAQQLHEAMDGLGTEEKPIIDVMASHDNKQRQEIALSYKTQFGKDLRAELKCETSGNFENLLVALLETPINYDAKSINDAIKFVGTDEGALIEILSSRSKVQIKSIKAAYKTRIKLILNLALAIVLKLFQDV